MNRRNFLAGLLATTAAVPLASAFAADMGVEPAVAFDLAGGRDATAVFFSNPSGYSWVERGFKAGLGFYAKREGEFIPWGPDPGTIWLDEATDIEVAQWDVLRQILDANPVPADSKLLWPTVDDVI